LFSLEKFSNINFYELSDSTSCSRFCHWEAWQEVHWASTLWFGEIVRRLELLYAYYLCLVTWLRPYCCFTQICWWSS